MKSLASLVLAFGSFLWQSGGSTFRDASGHFYQYQAGSFARLDKVTGKDQWRAPLQEIKLFGNSSFACFAPSGLVIAQDGPKLVARAPDTGAEVWSAVKQSSGATHCSQQFGLLLDGPDAKGDYQVLSAENGQLLFRTNPGLPASSISFAEDREGLLFTYWKSADLTDWRSVVMDPRTGALKTTYRCPEGSVIPLIQADAVYCSSFDGKVSRLDRQDGHVLWTTSTGSGSFGINIRPNGSLLIEMFEPQDRALYALDASSGAVLWSSSAPDYPQIRSLPGNEVLLSWSETMTSTLLNADGSVRWTRPFALQLINGGLYQVESSGLVRRIAAETGDALWSFTADDKVPGLLESDDAGVYIAVGRYPNQGVIVLDPGSGQFIQQTDRVLALEATRGGIASSVTTDAERIYIRHPSGLSVISRLPQPHN